MSDDEYEADPFSRSQVKWPELSNERHRNRCRPEWERARGEQCRPSRARRAGRRSRESPLPDWRLQQHRRIQQNCI